MGIVDDDLIAISDVSDGFYVDSALMCVEYTICAVVVPCVGVG